MPALPNLRPDLSAATPMTRALLWALAASVISVTMNVIIRATADELHPFLISFWRCFFALLFFLPWLWTTRLGALRGSKLRFYLLRAVVSSISVITWYWGLAYVPLGTATALNFTAPLFATAAAALVLGETVRMRRWSAVALGFVGVLVILRPGAEAIEAGSLIILLSAAAGAMSATTIKFLVRSENPVDVAASMALLVTPVTLLPALAVWSWPSLPVLGVLILLGFLGTLSQIAGTRAFAHADASAVMPLEFLRLPMAALAGFLAFGEITDLWTWAGGAIIVGSTLYVAHREAKLQRQGAQTVRASGTPTAP